MSFASLGLSKSLVKTVAEQEFTQPTPVQQEAIPAILKGKDLVGIAQTGSGKTAAYVLPVLEMLQKKASLQNRFARVLVLVPTRELALQVDGEFRLMGMGLSKRVKSLAVFGGVSINPQMMQLNGVEVLVATPGRLLDLVSHKAVQLSAVEILVLDEADKILHMGFQEEVNKVLSLLPARRQNILFSATLGEEVEAFSAGLLQAPVKIQINEEASTPELIKQVAYQIDPAKKGPFLRYLIKENRMQQVLVFASSIRTANNVAGKLQKNGIQAAAMHGDKSQGARTEALKKFKNGKLRVLVATDLASRGIDIKFLPYVINYELPRSPKDYVHRIGRTGRAEAAGEAISLIGPEEMHHFGVIQKKMGRRVEILPGDSIDLTGY
jgi:ATP-dependent RNA helicase RhlE